MKIIQWNELIEINSHHSTHPSNFFMFSTFNGKIRVKKKFLNL
jgi:hypothetical protein